MSYKEWAFQGMTFIAFDTTPDKESAEDHISKPTRGALTLVINTGTPLAEDYTVLAMFEYDEILKIAGPGAITYIQ